MLWDAVQIFLCFCGMLIAASLIEYTCDEED